MQLIYSALTKDGTRTKGLIDAPDKFAAARMIREKGEFPISVKSSKKKFDLNLNIPFLSSVSLHEKILFTKNLSGMLTAGLSLTRALSVLAKQSKNKMMQSTIEALIKNIDQGGTLSEGMKKFPKIFSVLFVSMIRAGEESGKMAEALQEVGSSLEKSYKLNKKVKGAMTYPMIIMIAIFCIGVLMMIYVVPTLTKTFQGLGVALPLPTRIIIGISNFLINHTIIFLCAVGLIVFGGLFMSKFPRVKRSFDFVVLHLPFVGNLTKEINSARTARTLSSLLTSGVSVTRSLEITKDVLENHYYKDVIDHSITAVQKGVPLSQIFRDNTKLYPIMVGEMMEVGDETGKTSDMLIDIAEFYENEVDSKTKDLSTIIEPVLMIFIGIAVGFFAVSMLTPMYSILDNIN
jgi:type II secretory pathway component PulF